VLKFAIDITIVATDHLDLIHAQLIEVTQLIEVMQLIDALPLIDRIQMLAGKRRFGCRRCLQ
jgi:hypothetical protein